MYRFRVKGIRLDFAAEESFVHKARAELERSRSLKKAKSQGQIPVSPRSIPALQRAATTNQLHHKKTSVNTPSTVVVGGYAIKFGTNSSMGRHHSDSLESDSEETLDRAAPDSKHSMYAADASAVTETMTSRLLDHEDNAGDRRITQKSIGSVASHSALRKAVNGVQASHAVSNVSSSSLFTDDDFYDNDSQSSSDSEGPTTLAGKAIHWFTMPLQILFKCTCPPAGEGQSCEALYGFTFFISVVHVAVFSFLLSSVIGAWVSAWGMPQALFGMILISIGAEIPDTIESVTMARKAYGSMAVSNCQGTQVINIGIGLGLPWLMTNLTGHHVYVCGHEILQVSAIFQTSIVLCNFSLLVGLALFRGAKKARLQRWKAMTLIGMYVTVLLGFTLYLYLTKELFKSTECGKSPSPSPSQDYQLSDLVDL